MHPILDDNFLDLIVESSLAALIKEYEMTPINSRYTVIHSPQTRINMCVLGDYPYHIFPKIYTPTSLISHEKSGVFTVQNNSSFALYGQGILIGIVDTGIDYLHPAFLNADGSTRLFSIWDQTIESGSPPANFTFGSEYNKTLLNTALRDGDPLTIVPSFDENGHGTMLAGIAAGNRNISQSFSGVAPEAELVVVKLAQTKYFNRKIFNVPNYVTCFPETNILLGIEYLQSVAVRLNRPLVICFGLGSSQNSHEGHSALTRHLNILSTMPRLCTCASAGNEGNLRRHYSGTFSYGETLKTFELHVGPTDSMFSMEIWQKSPGRLTFELISPAGERVQSIPPRFNECRVHNFVLETSKVYINNIIVEEGTGEQLILIRFENALSGIWTFRVMDTENLISSFNTWLPAGNIISSETYFLEPDPYVTITSPGNATNVLTVTAYNEIDNSILLSSSRGYSADGKVNPDLAAPGFSLPAPIPGGDYARATGTGAAAAHTAGVAAMLMEWAVLRGNYTTITGRDISRLLIRGARRDGNMLYPNPTWGYGQLDIMGTFRSLL